MFISVENLLTFPGLAESRVLAGEGGLGRIVTKVNVVDVPDIEKWTRGGEFLITTGFFAKDDPAELAGLVHRICAAGASALGIKLGRFIDEVPPSVLQAAEELDFPLIELPANAAFADIINVVLSSIVNEQIESRYRDLFVQDLLFNNIRSLEEVQKRAGFFGWELRGGMAVCIVDIDNFKQRYVDINDDGHREGLEDARRRIFAQAHRDVEQHMGRALYTNFSDSTVFIVQSRSLGRGAFVKRLQAAGQQICAGATAVSDFTVTVGVGSCVDDPLDLHQSYKEARDAVRLSLLARGFGRVALYEELGVYKLLAPLQHSEAAREYVGEVLGPLLSYDRDNDGELLKTLAAIAAHDWNLRATAESLYLHYNTVKYRFARIGVVMGRDLADSEHKLAVLLALKLRQLG